MKTCIRGALWVLFSCYVGAAVARPPNMLPPVSCLTKTQQEQFFEKLKPAMRSSGDTEVGLFALRDPMYLAYENRLEEERRLLAHCVETPQPGKFSCSMVRSNIANIEDMGRGFESSQPEPKIKSDPDGRKARETREKMLQVRSEFPSCGSNWNSPN